MRAALLLSAALILAPTAHAQMRVNDQYQGVDANASTTVNVGEADDVGATAIASGNVVTSTSDDEDHSLGNTQHMDGETNANANATVWDADGVVAVTSAAVANGATAAVEGGDVDVQTNQAAHADASATTTFIGGYAGDASTSASASGNVVAVSAGGGQARVVGTQESIGAIRATTEADHCCVSGQVVSAAIASSNNLSVGGDTATVVTDTTQYAAGSSAARVDLHTGYATDASGNATANANAVTIDNQWGYVNARADQRSEANVSAESYVTLGGDFVGFGSAGAYGVGNQAIVSNVDSDTVMDTIQTNSGDVSANTALAGEGAGMALASSAAYGNTVTGSLCGYCDENTPGLYATNSQTNLGDVSSSAIVISPRARTVAAMSAAIGNAATYQVAGPGDTP